MADDIATLYTALGGGWQIDQPAVPVSAAPPPLPAAVDRLATPGE